MYFYFVRHGTTINNQNHTFNGGGVDPVLTGFGQAEAQKLGHYLQEVHFVLKENKQARPAIKILPALTEMDLGDWDGVSITQLNGAPQIENYFHKPDLFDGHSLHAESYHDLQRRGYQALEQIIKSASGKKNVLIASHGLLLTTLLKSLNGTDLRDIRKDGLVATSSVTIFESKDGTEFKLKDWALKPAE
ncbi:histidine phosphatase family protein [Ligilactobacillus acidipiscis]|uniref:histidine phosphatase family protein n=1 Tax=Ligilactobacillus acidipiscis TaxID=89059 RepID=UPI0023F9B61D|nr:histidine phosphatase family protein [Ligilactobacillus acidipiscis]WEV57181.1 histidine phosphatase family protein [Ligilactobacillus acidipiscis]